MFWLTIGLQLPLVVIWGHKVKSQNVLGEGFILSGVMRRTRGGQWFIAIIQWQLTIIQDIHHTHLWAGRSHFNPGSQRWFPHGDRQMPPLNRHLKNDSCLESYFLLHLWSTPSVLLIEVVYWSFMESMWWLKIHRSSPYTEVWSFS